MEILPLTHIINSLNAAWAVLNKIFYFHRTLTEYYKLTSFIDPILLDDSPAYAAAVALNPEMMNTSNRNGRLSQP